jgi:F0F1-type ATP synthase epsilon subunit
MFDLTLICNEEKIFEGQVREVKVKVASGLVSILSGHQPYMAKIEGDVAYVEQDGAERSVGIDVGFVYTNGTHSFVVVDRAQEPA